MTKLIIRSTIATTEDIKSTNCLVDSGRTHNFFHSKSSYLAYERINLESMKSAYEKSIVAEKGIMKLSIDEDIIVKAYHTLHYFINIICRNAQLPL